MGERNINWAGVCGCGCPAGSHYADDGHWQCIKHMELGDHEPPRREVAKAQPELKP